MGSVHTLGALHAGHETCIRLAAQENDAVFVSIYPNKSQLKPGTTYRYDVDADLAAAEAAGATHAIAPADEEMFPDNHRTFLEQGPCYGRMDGSLVPFLFRGMITMSFRWVNLLRPTRAYWGMKDIGQTLLVERAIADFNVPSSVRRVPCVRYRNGIPISSRLAALDSASLNDIAAFNMALHTGLTARRDGMRNTNDVVALMRQEYEAASNGIFSIAYLNGFLPSDFTIPERLDLPFILHGAVTNGEINHFDGILVENETVLRAGPETIWI